MLDLYSARKVLPRIRGNIEKALTLDPHQTDALISSVFVRYFVDRHYQDGLDGMAKLVGQHPNNANLLLMYGHAFQSIGRYDLVFSIFDRMIELDPLSPNAHLWRGAAFENAGRLHEARESYIKTEQLGLSIPLGLAAFAFLEGDIHELQAQLDRDRSDWGPYGSVIPICEAWLPYLEGDHRRAKEIIQPLWRSKDPILDTLWIKAIMALTVGDKDAALGFLLTLDQISYGNMIRNGLGVRGKEKGAPSRSLARA